MRMIVTQRTFFSIGAGEFPWGAQSCLDLCLALNFEDCNVTICSTLNINFWRIMNTCSRFINTYTYTYLYFHLHYVWIFFRKWVRHVVFNLIHLPYIQMIYIYDIHYMFFSPEIRCLVRAQRSRCLTIGAAMATATSARRRSPAAANNNNL